MASWLSLQQLAEVARVRARRVMAGRAMTAVVAFISLFPMVGLQPLVATTCLGGCLLWLVRLVVLSLIKSLT